MAENGKVIQLRTGTNPHAVAVMPPEPVAEPVLFPESILEDMKRMLAPMVVTYFDDYAIRAEGTEMQARQAMILQGRALPGDVKKAQRRFVFQSEDGRKVEVMRHGRKAGGLIEVHVRKTVAEDREIMEHGRAARERMQRGATQEAKELESAEYRSAVITWVDLIRLAVLQGNRIVTNSEVATRRLSTEDTAAAIDALDQLGRVVCNATIVRCGPAARASLSVV